MNLFGSGKKKKQPKMTTADSIMKLNETLEVLNKREAHIQKKIAAQLNDAKKLMREKNKRGAMFALKRKKMYEKEIEKIQGARITLEGQIITLEGAAINVQTFQAMQHGANAMRNVRGTLDTDKVADIMDDIEDEKDFADQIADTIGRPAQDMDDDEELLQELEMLEEEEMANQILDTPDTLPTAPTNNLVNNLPSIPTNTPNIQKVDEEEDEDLQALADLEASMMMG